MIKIFTLLLIVFSYAFSSSNVLNKAIDLKLYDKNEWKALLHYENGFYTQDKKFILSEGETPKAELIATIDGFFKDQSNYKNPNNHPQCKFPARKLFIEHELGETNLFPHISCPDLNEYMTKAPADNISLIYVSENVKNPTSMMGHSFFKFDGTVGKTKVSHAASFYTIIKTSNPISLAYENLHSGMPGLFSLRPYQEVVSEYMNEDRNIWEYTLNLNTYRKELIYYHVWELKDIDLKYFFASYNCSTVVYFSLVLANPKLYKQYTLWMSPLQSAKLLYKNNLIAQVELKPTNEWLLRMSYQQIREEKADMIVKIVEKQEYSKINNLDYIELQFLVAYATTQFESKNFTKTKLENLLNYINKNVKNLGTKLDISAYKSPSKIPNERQVKIGYASYNKEGFFKLGFLPASHLLGDDNREYFTESDLRIFELSLIANDKNVYLDEFNLYGMKSYIPFEKYTQNLSYEFEIKVDRELNRAMQYQYVEKIDGGIGLDVQIFNDIHIFGMLNIGAGYDNLDKLYLNTEPYIGFMVYEIGNMKSVVRYSQRFINGNRAYQKLIIDHNIFFHKNWKINATYKHYNNLQTITIDEFEFSLNYMF